MRVPLNTCAPHFLNASYAPAGNTFPNSIYNNDKVERELNEDCARRVEKNEQGIRRGENIAKIEWDVGDERGGRGEKMLRYDEMK